MTRSAHCTTTMLTKKAVWHVNSTIFLCSYVWDTKGRQGEPSSWHAWPGGPEELRGQALAHPLLPVAVLHVVDPAVIPLHAEPQQVGRQEAILSQDHKVSEEASQGLDHTCQCGRDPLSLVQGRLCHWLSDDREDCWDTPLTPRPLLFLSRFKRRPTGLVQKRPTAMPRSSALTRAQPLRERCFPIF